MAGTGNERERSRGMFVNFRKVIGYDDRYLITKGWYVYDQQEQRWLKPKRGVRCANSSALPWESRSVPLVFTLVGSEGSEKRRAEGLWLEAVSSDSEEIALDVPALPSGYTCGRWDIDGSRRCVLTTVDDGLIENVGDEEMSRNNDMRCAFSKATRDVWRGDEPPAGLSRFYPAEMTDYDAQAAKRKQKRPRKGSMAEKASLHIYCYLLNGTTDANLMPIYDRACEVSLVDFEYNGKSADTNLYMKEDLMFHDVPVGSTITHLGFGLDANRLWIAAVLPAPYVVGADGRATFLATTCYPTIRLGA